jgi:tetratricopeptide (TPR) repeat protein
MDIGGAWEPDPVWSVAAVIKNLGGRVEKYNLPTSLRLAAAFGGLNQRLLVDTELDLPFSTDPADFGIGAEFRIWNWLDVRAGFKTMMKQSDTSMDSLMLGIGFNFMNFGLDLAITGREGLDTQSSLTLGYCVGGMRDQPLRKSKPEDKAPPTDDKTEALVQELEKVKKAAKLRAGPDLAQQAGFHYQAGREYEKYGKTIDAIVEYQAALKIRPDYPEAQEALAAARGTARKEEKRAKGKKDRKGRPGGSLQKLIRKYYERGLAAYKKKDYSTAIKQLQLVLEMTSQHQQATNLLNKAKEALDQEQAILRQQAKQAGLKGDLAGEIDAYRKMLDLDPGNKRIKTKLDQAVKKVPETVERLYKEGLDNYAQGRFRSALKSFETLLKIQPDHVKARDAVKNIKEKLIQTGQ